MRILLLLCVAATLHAQDSDPWNGLRAKNPPELTVTLRLVNPHVFRHGEVIAAELKLPEHSLMEPSPPAEQWQFAGVLLDPLADCGAIAKPCFGDPAGMGPGLISGLFSGLFNGPRGVSDSRAIVLNSYLPPLPPGHYRAAALARKLVLGNRGPASVSYIYADPPQYAVSGTVDIVIVPATSEWVRQTIAASVATLTGPQPRDSSGYQAQENAAQQLAFLNDPGAWSASLDLLPNAENVLLAGLSRGRPAARVCDLMQARVPGPAQSVSISYLYRMTEICARANLPAPKMPLVANSRPSAITAVLSPTPPIGPLAPANPELMAWSAQQRVYTQDLLNKATTALAGSLTNKQPLAKLNALATLFQHINQLRNNRPPEPDPTWIPHLRLEFASAFPTVEVPRQQYLLDLYSSTMDSQESAPLLERVIDSWKPGDYYEAAHSALRALNRVDPARARARVLAELVKEKTWLDLASLEIVPGGEVPPMDDALIDQLARAQRSGGWNPQLSMAAIARFATPKALPRIRAIYESQQNACQPELMAYFVRVDPAYAERVFHSHPWDMHAPPPACTVQYFSRTPPLAMGPALEEYLGAYLMSSDIHVKTVAAQTLARYGTKPALAQLWDTFRYFHNYWKGKEAELAQNGQGVELEVALRNALARGRGWLVTESELKLIESLCISGRCIQETRQDLEQLKPPFRMEISMQPSGLMGRIAQYFGLESVAAMEAKLAQFPQGTQFILYAPGGSAAALASQIRGFAEGRGLMVTVQ